MSASRGWKLTLADGRTLPDDQRERLVALAIDAAEGRIGLLRKRSRHAETRIVTKAGPSGRDLFVKVVDPPRGVAMLKRMVRGSVAAHVAAITGALILDGLRAPPVLLWGTDASDREVIVTERAEGSLLPRRLRDDRECSSRRMLARALGAEIARLHRAGFLHGDLTPFNVIVTHDREPSFVFLDHERTRKTRFARLERARLRNLVQLGRFELTGVTRTDRMRVWHSYFTTMKLRGHRSRLRRLMRMIAARAEDSPQVRTKPAPLMGHPEAKRS